MKKLIILLIIIYPIILSGQVIDNLIIQLPSIDLTIDSIFSIMKKQQGIVFSYSNSIKLETKIHFDNTSITVDVIAKTISSQAEINYKISGKKILFWVKKKKRYVSGSIKDASNNDLLPGAHVRVDNSNYGTSSDDNGHFIIKLEEGEHLLSFSFLGYQSVDKTITILDETSIDIELPVSTNSIDEVHVTKQRNLWKNLDIGRSISTIDSKKIESLNTNNAADILQARVPGVWSTQASGAPGDHQKVKIRGINSIFGCTDPLYIIDGVAVPIVNMHSLGIAELNIHDIESVTVMKDASSNAIYGYQGGNGVIIIDTKRGKEKHISFIAKYGIQQVAKKYNLLNTKEFLTSLDSAMSNTVSQIRKYYPIYSDTLANSNWQDVIFRDGIIKEYQLSGSANVGKNNIYVSGNYYTHEGIVTNSGYNRYTASANLGRNFGNKFSADFNFRASYQKNSNNLDTYKGNTNILEGLNKSPLVESTPDSLYYWPQQIKEESRMNINRIFYNYSPINAYPGSKVPTDSLLNFNNNYLEVSTNAFDIRAKYLFNENLFINAVSSITSRKHVYFSDLELGFPSYMKSDERYLLFNQQANLNYLKNLGGHSIQLTAGYRNYTDNAYWRLDSIKNDFRRDNMFLKNSLAINGEKGSIIRLINSFSAISNYNYANKYFLSLVANHEILTINHYVNYSTTYPSIAASWDISKEPIFNTLKWLNEFSLFCNWGKAGNMPVNALAIDFYKDIMYGLGDSTVRGRTIEQFANHYLNPEMITEYNTGLTIGLFNKRLQLTAEYYKKNSKDLILIRDIPTYYGGGRFMINVGSVSNVGYEFGLDADLISTPDFSWSISSAYSTNNLKVNEIGKDSILIFYSDDALIPQFEVKENAELGVIKGYKYLGSYTPEDELTNNRMYVGRSGSKYLNNDTTDKAITEKDMVVLGKTLPDFTWHLSSNFSWRNFSLAMLWYGVSGVSKYNATKASTYMSGVNSDVRDFIKEGNRTLTSEVFYNSSYFVEDASFVRLKQLTLSYLFNKKIKDKVSVRLSMSFDNLLTFTHYTGYDPEATIYTDNSFSDYAVDRGAYPNPKAMYVTLNLDF
jgi:TonB-linked SusC/RagA family outer membrane protein